MPILNVVPVQIGVVGNQPQQVNVQTNDTVNQVVAAGYLNDYIARNPGIFNESTICLVATKTSPSAVSTQLNWYEVTYNVTTKNWSLVAPGAPEVSPDNCTITAVAGAANVATITIQLKDACNNNIARITPFRVYSSSAANGLTLQSVASTGYSVASGGLSLNNAAAITTQISCMSSATGGCVLSLTDTNKATSYLVLVLGNGCKISTQLTSASYG